MPLNGTPNAKGRVFIPFSRIHTVGSQAGLELLIGRGFFSTSKIVITTSEGARIFHFGGSDKAHVAPHLILEHMI
jgi:hypothetical protein